MGRYTQKIVNSDGENFVAGDRFDIPRTITALPVGRSVVRAWITFKQDPLAADPGDLQKVITTSYVPGQGQITDSGTSGTASISFEMLPANSALLGAGTIYEYDIQLKLDNGEIATHEKGTIELELGVTGTTT